MIAAGAGDNSITIFQEDPLSGDSTSPTFNLLTRTKQAHEQDVNAVAWNPQVAGLLASCSDDGTIKLWKASNFDQFSSNTDAPS